MEREFGRAGVAFERIAAVDGAALGEDALNAFRRARTTAKPERWLPGEVGCFLSHLEAWRGIAAQEEPFAAVFEDDLRVSADLAPLLASADWIPADADAVRLEANRSMRLGRRPFATAAPARHLHRAISGTAGAAAYILSRSTAQRLLNSPADLHTTVDVFLFKPKKSQVARELRRYQIVPAVCVQESVLEGQETRLKSLIKQRSTRGRGYHQRPHPLLRLWPMRRQPVLFRP